MTTAHELWVGFGSSILIFVVTGFIIVISVWSTSGAFKQIVGVENLTRLLLQPKKVHSVLSTKSDRAWLWLPTRVGWKMQPRSYASRVPVEQVYEPRGLEEK